MNEKKRISDVKDTEEEIRGEGNFLKGRGGVKRQPRNLWDNIKQTNIQNIGVPEEEREKWQKTYLKKY